MLAAKLLLLHHNATSPSQWHHVDILIDDARESKGSCKANGDKKTRDRQQNLADLVSGTRSYMELQEVPGFPRENWHPSSHEIQPEILTRWYGTLF